MYSWRADCCVQHGGRAERGGRFLLISCGPLFGSPALRVRRSAIRKPCVKAIRFGGSVPDDEACGACGYRRSAFARGRRLFDYSSEVWRLPRRRGHVRLGSWRVKREMGVRRQARAGRGRRRPLSRLGGWFGNVRRCAFRIGLDIYDRLREGVPQIRRLGASLPFPQIRAPRQRICQGLTESRHRRIARFSNSSVCASAWRTLSSNSYLSSLSEASSP